MTHAEAWATVARDIARILVYLIPAAALICGGILSEKETKEAKDLGNFLVLIGVAVYLYLVLR
jgi:hypothetical protein